MLLFLLGITVLIAGYFTYGKLVERIIAPDERETPAISMADGVDYLILPKWKNMLIQLLNIAGVGPVIGVILGIKFGVIVFQTNPHCKVSKNSVYIIIIDKSDLSYCAFSRTSENNIILANCFSYF